MLLSQSTLYLISCISDSSYTIMVAQYSFFFTAYVYANDQQYYIFSNSNFWHSEKAVEFYWRAIREDQTNVLLCSSFFVDVFVMLLNALFFINFQYFCRQQLQTPFILQSINICACPISRYILKNDIMKHLTIYSDIDILSMLIVSRIFLVGLLLVFGLAFRMDTLPKNSSTSSPESNANSKTQILFPLPKSISTNSSAEPLTISPCNINYKIVANSSINIQKIINNYLTNVFHCSSLNPENISLYINVKDPYTMTSLKTTQQKYDLIISERNQWTLNADTHVGFLRGFQTFSQLFEENGTDDKTYVIRGRPISISDQPDYIWRGVMLDTSRHYYPVDSILHLIDGLMYNRMSILHWHIIDEDSFPLEIPKRPQLSQYGNLGGTYSKQDLLQIINYAKVRGVRVIPEFDTPAHTESWGRSEALKQIIVKCNNQYEGQFDPTLDKTYQVVQDVMEYINSTFIDNYAHFGGDQVEQECWSQRQSIYQWMRAQNILTYKQLQVYYRQQEKKLWRTQISDTKKAIYWANEEIDLPVENDDVIHWWGVTKNVNKLAGRPNEVILSNYDITYLDIGFGGRYGTGYGTYITWRQVYSFNPKIQNVNVIGGETCMWSETADQNCLDQKVWIRSCALAERVWNSNVDISKDLLNISERLISQARRMKNRGFKVSPVTVGLCEKDPSICFS